MSTTHQIFAGDQVLEQITPLSGKTCLSFANTCWSILEPDTISWYLTTSCYFIGTQLNSVSGAAEHRVVQKFTAALIQWDCHSQELVSTKILKHKCTLKTDLINTFLTFFSPRFHIKLELFTCSWPSLHLYCYVV